MIQAARKMMTMPRPVLIWLVLLSWIGVSYCQTDLSTNVSIPLYGLILICVFGLLCIVLIVILIALIIIVCVASKKKFEETKVEVNDIEAKRVEKIQAEKIQAEKIQAEKTRADRAKSAAEREDAKKAEEKAKSKSDDMDTSNLNKNRDINYNDESYFPSSISGSYYDRPMRQVNYMPPPFANPRPAYQGPYGSREELLEKEAEIRRMYRDMNAGFGVQPVNNNPMHYTSNAATYSDFANPAPARQAQRKWYLQ